LAICVWCGFDRLEEAAELCAVCGQTPHSGTVKLVGSSEMTEAATVMREPGSEPRPIARIFADHYVIDAPVGRGGMGSVFRVTDQRDGRTYALKVLHASAGASTSTLKRFEREAALLRRIRHDAVPAIHDYGIAGGSMYLVTEFVDGENLRDLIARGPLALDEVVRIGATIADCLNAAHEHGVVHRDIKPHNVMMTRDGGVRLIDFGIARDAAVNATAITGTDMLIGTPQSMSPEQFDGGRVDGRSDIYSLGVLLFEAATGRLPFRAETPTALGMKHVGEAPPHPRSIRAEVPMMLNRVILKCLEKHPAERYATAADLARDLRRSVEIRRRIERTRIGDFVVHEDTGEDWALVLASARERDWPAGTTLLFNGGYFKVARVDYDADYPAPYVYRFTFWPESEAIRRFVDYENEPLAPPPSPAARLKKWLGKWTAS
jgi:serine/threonine protein kinase